MILEASQITRQGTTDKKGFSFEVDGVADDWRDLEQGEVHEQDTSFTAEQTEVAEVYAGLKEKSWPDVWYELVQGAFDYNDWEKGNPEIIVTYENGESVPLQAFVREWPRTRRAVRKVAILNHIKGDSGLRPSNTYLTQHQEKDGATEFGKHGRGLKGALTAIVAHQLAQDVTFESHAPGVGSWFGKARMTADKVDSQAPDHYQVVYKTTQQEQVPLTSIAVEKPSEMMLEALVQLQNWFLPLHPDYQFSPLADPLRVLERHTLNPTTLLRTDNIHSTESRYTSQEAAYLNDCFPIGGRAEIIPRQLLPDAGSGRVGWLYVDGWRVSSGNKEFANTYAFSGLSKNVDESRNPRRSNDSLRVDGEYDSLIADALYFSHDPEIFYRIFKYGWNEHSCAEWGNVWLDADILASFPETLEAIKKAWIRIAYEHNLKPPLYITESKDTGEIASKKYGISVLNVNSRNWSKILLKTGLVKSLSAFLEAQAEKQKQIAEASLHALGILEQATSTGEIVKLRRQPLSADQQHLWLSELAYQLAGYEGSFSYDAENQVFSITLNEHAVDGVPQSVAQLNELGKLINHFYALFGETVSVGLEARQSKNAIYMNFNFNSAPDALGNHSLHVGHGKLIPDEKKGTTVTFQINALNREVGKGDRQSFNKFFSDLLSKLQKISFPDGKINPSAYNASELADYHPQAHLMLELRRQRERIEAEMLQQLAVVNALLEKAGLPTKTAEDFIEKPKGQLVGESKKKPENQGQSIMAGLKQVVESGKGKLFSTQKITDGPRTYEKTIDLGHPDEAWGLSSMGEEEALLQISKEKNWYERWQQQLRDSMEKALKALVNPDISFDPGPSHFQLNRYLVHSIDSGYSSVSVKDYLPLPKALVRKRLQNKTSITFNKPDSETSLRALPCPYGYQPVGYFTPKGEELVFSGIQERGVFAFRSPKGISAGLTVYFEPIPDFSDTNQPDEHEASVKVIEGNLEPHWQNLIEGLRQSSLTDKQKVDVLLRAWKRNQRYKKTQTTFDQYKGMGGVMLATTVVNRAEGNCGYMDLGFIGLASTLLPSRSVKSFLFDGVGFDVNPSRHALSQIYIDGRWVAIEAQGFYVQSGYAIEAVPEADREAIEALLNDVPESLQPGLDFGLGLGSGDSVEEHSQTVPTMSLAMLFASLQAAGVDVKPLLENTQNSLSSDEKITAAEMRKTILKYAAVVGVGIAGAQLLDAMSTKLVDIAVNYRIALEGLPAAEVFDKIYESLDFLADPRMMMVMVVLLTYTAWQGGYYFGLENSANKQSKLIPTDLAAAPAEAKDE